MFFNYFEMQGEQRSDFCYAMFEHLEDLGKRKNHTIYIGPGRVGRSRDRLAVFCKFEPRHTMITANEADVSAGYVKTSYGLFSEPDPEYPLSGKNKQQWMLIEDQVLTNHKTRLDNLKDHEPPSKVVLIVHPRCSDPAGLGEDGEVDLRSRSEPKTVNSAMMFTLDEDEDPDAFACYYCGIEERSILTNCKTCGFDLCTDCQQEHGCACYLADGEQFLSLIHI